MKLYLCTLFDSNYLDKGLVLHESLEKNCKDYMLYLLPMDEKCAEVLKNLNLQNVTVIDYAEFEDDDLVRVKAKRTSAEFCWTCTAKLIKFVVRKFNVPLCTYIDADLYFYEDPDVLVQEMIDTGSYVQIVRHNFRKFERKESEKSSGTYCVEFNTFVNNEDGMRVLESWETDCIRECSYGRNSEVMGDQKYLDKWPLQYDCINICANQGAGVAPWNINKFTYRENNHQHYEIKDTESGKTYSLVFYHFQNIRFIDKREIECCSVNKRNRTIVSQIYIDYLKRIVRKKEMLYKNYGIESMIKVHPADVDKQDRMDQAPKDKGIKRIAHMAKSAYLITRANILHYLYCRNEENLIIDLE